MTSANALWKMFMDVQLEADDFLVKGFKELNLVDISSLNSKLLSCCEESNSASRTQGIEDLVKDLKAKTQYSNKLSNKENINNSTNSLASTVASDEPSWPLCKAAAVANDRVNIHTNASLYDKLQEKRPTIKIKQEKLSDVPEVQFNNNSIGEVRKSPQEMPPPATLPKRACRKKKEETINVEKSLSIRTRKNGIEDINVQDDTEDNQHQTSETPERIRSPSSHAKKQTGSERSKTKELTPARKRSLRYVDADGKVSEAADTTRVSKSKSRQKTKEAEAAAEPVNSKSQLSSSAQKALNAIKLSSQQFRKYEQLRKEKEAAAIFNKNMYLSEETEKKRRCREEKELKVKQKRTAIEEEKQRTLDLQRAKEERSKRVLQNKQQEESERRLLSKQKYVELMRAKEQRLKKKQEEVATLRKAGDEKFCQKQEETELAKMADQPKPIYMTQSMPKLPTPDCYDSDDENKVPVVLPPWNSKEGVRQRMNAMANIQTSVFNTLFCVKAQTPNPQNLFPMVDPGILRRNSSAIWKQVPRFTMETPIADV